MRNLTILRDGKHKFFSVGLQSVGAMSIQECYWDSNWLRTITLYHPPYNLAETFVRFHLWFVKLLDHLSIGTCYIDKIPDSLCLVFFLVPYYIYTDNIRSNLSPCRIRKSGHMLDGIALRDAKRHSQRDQL